MSKFKKFLLAHLQTSKNNFIKRLKWNNWSCIANVDFTHDPIVLIKDALRNLKINGKLFCESQHFLNLPPDLRNTKDFILLEPVFKLFLRENLFPDISDTLFETEYARLKAAYGQPVLGGALSAVSDSACARFLKNNGKVTVSLNSESKKDNLTYQKGTFHLETNIKNLIYTHADTKLFSEPYQVTLPTSINYACEMPSVQNNFSLAFVETSNSYGDILFFEEDVDIKKLVELEEHIQASALIDQTYDACENYKVSLKESLVTEIQKEDPALAMFFKETQVTLQITDEYLNQLDIEATTGNKSFGKFPSSVNIMATGKETGLDNLIKNEDMDEKISQFSKPAQLAIRKYKLMCALQTILNGDDELGIDIIRKFDSLFSKNETLLKKSRDTNLITFLKIVASIATLGAAAPFLFHTKGHDLIKEVVSMFNQSLKQKTEQPENYVPEQSASPTFVIKVF